MLHPSRFRATIALSTVSSHLTSPSGDQNAAAKCLLADIFSYNVSYIVSPDFTVRKAWASTAKPTEVMKTGS